MRGASNWRELVEPSRELPEKDDIDQQVCREFPGRLVFGANTGGVFKSEQAAACMRPKFYQGERMSENPKRSPIL